MDALERIALPFTKMLNRNIQKSSPARELCEQLSGKVIAINVEYTPLKIFFFIEKETLSLMSESESEPELEISGSLVTLASLIARSGDNAIRDGSLNISGDARVADIFQKLLKHSKPDIEEELSSLIGDVAANRVGEISRGFIKWGKEARSTMEINIREYLQEESRSIPSRYENDKFNEDINLLRDDVDRLEARINQMKEDL